MVKSATALLEEDERLKLRLDESGEEITRSSARRKLSQDWQRVVFYLAGGVVGLACLLLLAEHMNPPDSALRDQRMAASLGTLDGAWEGTLTRYTVDGRTLEEVAVRREYWSATEQLQTANFLLSYPDGREEVQVWVNRIEEDGMLRSHRGEPNVGNPVFEGRIVGGQVFLQRRTDSRTELRRTWVSDNAMYVEEVSLPMDGTLGTITTGKLERHGTPLRITND